MRKKIIPVILILTTSFVLLGEIFGFFMDDAVYESDYYYTVDAVKDNKTEARYIEDLKKYSKLLKIEVYSVTRKENGYGKVDYIIYAEGDTAQKIKKRLALSSEEHVYNSLISGKKTVRIKSLNEIPKTERIEQYFAYGSKNKLRKLRSYTIEEYGMSKPGEMDVSSNMRDKMTFGILLITILGLIMYIYFETNSKKKEVLVKFINGTGIGKSVGCSITENISGVIVALIVAYFIAAIVSEVAFVFTQIVILALLAIMVSAAISCIYFKIDVRKTFSKALYSKKFSVFCKIILSISMIVATILLSYTSQLFDDSIKTIKQKEHWEQYKDCSTVIFASLGEENDFNTGTDDKNIIEFYRTYLQKGDIEFSIDPFNNSSPAHLSNESKESGLSFVLMNKTAARKIDDLPIKENQLTKKCTCFTRLSKEELTGSEKIREDLEMLPISTEDLEIVTLKKDFTVLVNDVNIDNLADNYKKNPILIVDNRDASDILYENEKDKELAGYLFASTVKFTKPDEFNKFIQEIGYESQRYSCTNVYESYNEKLTAKKFQLIASIVISVLMLAFLLTIINSTLKVEFSIKKQEIFVRKIMGTSKGKRYKTIVITFLTGAVVTTVAGIALCLFMNLFKMQYFIIGESIVLILIVLIILSKIKKYEKESINAVLKGGLYD